MKLARHLLGIVMLLLAPSCFGAIAHVQQASSSDMCVNGYTSFSATFGSSTTSGNAIIVALTFDHDPGFTVTDSQGNIYSEAIRTYDTVHAQGNAIFYSTNIRGGSSTTVTVNFAVETVCLALSVHEYSGIAASSALDVTAGQTASGQTTLTSGSATTTANGDLIFVSAMDDSISDGDTYTAGTGFTKRVDLGMAAGFADEDRIQTSAGSIAGTWTLSPSRDTLTDMAAFKASTSGGSPSPSITNLSPLSGGVGTTITITGTHFGATQGSSTVKVNGTIATLTTSSACPAGWSDTCVAITVPNGATTGPVVVSVAGLPSNGVNFSVTTGVINLVQQAANGSMVGDYFSSFSATFPGPTTGGNTIILAISVGIYTDLSVTDSQNNTYTQAIRLDDYRNNCYNGLAIFYATNIVGGSSDTITVQFDANVAYIGLGIHEYSGIANSSPLDGTAGNTGTGTSVSSGAATTTTNGDLIFSAAWEDTVGFGDAFTAGGSFTKLLDLNDEVSYVDADEVQTNAGSVAGTWTLSPSELNWMATIAAFKAAAAGNGPPSITSLSPSTNSVGGLVAITGTNFGGAQGSSTVKFNGTAATVTSSSTCPSGWSNTCIAVTVPNGATTGPVVVTVAGVASNGVNFTVIVNQPPSVTVGGDQTISYPTNTAKLTGTVSDDGYPIGNTLQIGWSKVIGPGTVTFSNPAQPNAQATFSLPGNYVLRLSANDGQFTSAADTRVIYSAPAGGGIIVSAGPDQVLVFPVSASLSGSASDSNPALAASLATTWSMVSGPGTVNFGNSATPSTTATFSVPGVYDLRLTGTDGVFTASSDLKIYIGRVQCTLSNKSTDFWLMFIGADVGGNPNDLAQQQLNLFISSDVTTTGTVSVPGQGFNSPFTTTPGQITSVILPQSVQIATSDSIETKGVHITSQDPIAVYGLNFVPAATDGYLGLPTSTLGTSYVIASYRNTEVGASNFGFGTEFGITATQDNTNVTIVPTASTGPKDPNHPFGTRIAQQPFTIQLNQGQTYQLRNNTDYTEVSSSSNLPVDYTGTVVTSDKPVAVFGGHNCTYIPDQFLACNHLVEQLPPTNLWGQNFVAMPLSHEANGDTYRVVAQTANTHVQVNHHEVALLQAGQFYEEIIQGPAEISANQPVLVVEYADSDAFAGTHFADPSMILVPPFEQFGGTYTINTPTSNFPDNFINVIAPTSAAQSSAVMLDGAPVLPASFQPIGTSPFSGAQLSVSVGPHSLSAGLPFGVMAYGFNADDDYGYTGGVCLASGVSGGSLAAQPHASTNQITSQVCIHATVIDSRGQLVGGAGVTFSIAGVNPQQGFATTNSNGVATFCYTSTRTGSDLITITSGIASDIASVTWVSNGPNQPPIVSAGPNLNIGQPTTTASLNGSVIDDGLPIGGTLTSNWTQVSGPAAVSFVTPNQPVTSATFPQTGTYVLKLTGSDSLLSAFANVTVTVFPQNQPPVVNAGPAQSFMMPSISTQTVQLNGAATDDGLPVGSTLALNWSEVSGSNSVSFGTPNSATTSVLISAPGSYVLRLSANDTQFVTSAYVNVNAFGPINVNFGPNQQGAVNTPITLNPTILVGGVLPTQAMPLHLNWVIDGQPAGSHVTFGSQNTASTTASFDTPGNYQLGLTTSDANIPIISQGNCCVTVTVAPVGAQPPTVSIATPVDGVQLTAPSPVTGSVSGGSWTLAYALQDDSNPMTFTTIATGTGAVSNATLGTLDPSILLNGTYALRLTSVDNTSGLFRSASIMVSVARNMKVGVFTISLNDLTVPVLSVPIQVIRSYDSRDKSKGDFGIGWRLSLANIRVQKSRSLAPNWQETQTSNGFLPQYCIAPTDNKVVTVTFPDGRVFTFLAGNNPQCQLAGSITNAQVAFTELPGPANTAGATLSAADGGQSVIDGDIPGAVNLIGFDGNPYNPTVFVLQTADGTKYTIDQQLGLTAVTDKNGNTLTITSNGISSSAGKSVPFARDEQGRITNITDPAGNTLLYSYDSNGNLGSSTDRNKNTTTYIYDASHNLTQAILPDGTDALTNAFDSNGRLTSTKDGKGFTVSFSNNVSGQTQTITDRNGHATTYVYDTDGNITQVTDALGHVTTSTYDANDNKLSETNALGKTSHYTYDNNGNRLTETDPLQHTTTYTYNALNKPLTIQDSNGHTTTNTYDTNGNLLTTMDPLGKTTTNTYFSTGLLATTRDPLGNVTSFAYDGSGNLTSQTDALGTVTTYTYDGNGNRTSQSVTRTLPGGSQQTLNTAYVYDGNGHLTKTTLPDNSTAQTAYNTLSQQITTTDPLGRQTSYVYDSDGHVTQTTYPDNTTESSIYDNNGNRTRFIDRRAVLTSYVYDVLNRLTQTQNNSAQTLSATTYDAIGQVLTSTDANSNTTQYTYDDAGRRLTVTDALTHVTTFGYDAVGNQTSLKDANDNITSYLYDNDNRRTQVTYPDTKFETTTYDALGRVTARNDANGKTTQYGYDAIGRLTSVTDALNQVTSYSYDQVGNRLTQTDANTHTTNYNYDQRGRRTQRTLPFGQSEGYTYDSAGNLLTHTDFNSKTTTYTYDPANRLRTKTPDASFNTSAVTYTYTATGMRHTMTDLSGTTTYVQYDDRARLTQVTKPAGSLQYIYDLAGNLTRLSGQTNVNYTYDALNRLSTANEVNTGTTTYAYDNVGNLQSVTAPNGVAHSYTYDTRNRLTNLGVNKSATAIASYAYTLDAAGHRLSVSELSGRTVNYGYDNLYRLTSETIASDPHSINGAVNYIYDPVGNRKQITSTLAAVPAGLWNYDANDRFTAGDTYDADGNTVSSGGIANVYDFENHLIQKGGVTIVYDGDGNRVSKTVTGITTTYLVDTLNPTGYAQVVNEAFSGNSSPNRELSHSYVYGLELISQTRNYTVNSNSTTQKIYYAYDGHGSVRALTDPTGAVTDTYDYDAFGNLVHSSTTLSTPTLNNYLFAGEQFDPDLNLYYNRARYLNVTTGRFWSMDNFEGSPGFPRSLHKYLYSSGDPINRVDPSGNQDTLVEEAAEEGEEIAISTQTTVQPAVAATATTAAESVAVAAELKGALISAVLLGITVGTSVTLEGDNQPGPRPNPKNNDDSANRGSLQVQGKDILEGANSLNLVGHTDFKLDKNTLSWNWSQRYALDVFTANSRLSEFLDILTPVQIGRRRGAFYRASRFINGAALGGGTGPTKQSFNDRNPLYPDARVDINVDVGLAFVP